VSCWKGVIGWVERVSNCAFVASGGIFSYSVYAYPEIMSPEADLRPRPYIQSYSRLYITKKHRLLNAIGQQKDPLICGSSLDIHINMQGWREELKSGQFFQNLNNMSQWTEPKLNPQVNQSLLRS
jgi:hypothetical protein